MSDWRSLHKKPAVGLQLNRVGRFVCSYVSELDTASKRGDNRTPQLVIYRYGNMMAPLRIFLLISAFCLAYTAAEQLRCRVGDDLCKQLNWSYTGQINRDVVCCPSLSGQGLTIDMGLMAPDNCKCNAGTEEQYANHASGLRAGSFVLHVLWVTLTWCVFSAARLF